MPSNATTNHSYFLFGTDHYRIQPRDIFSGSKVPSYKPDWFRGTFPLDVCLSSTMRGFLRGKLLDRELQHGITPKQKIKNPSDNLSKPTYPTVAKPSRIVDVSWFTMPPYDPTRPGEPRTECMLYPSMKENILAIPGFPQPFRTPARPRYKIKPIKGLGITLVATMNIDVGELIMAERPLILSMRNVPFISPLSVYDPRELQRMLIERLTPEDREDFFALRNCKGSTRPDIAGIIDSNAIGLDDLPGSRGDCSAVCKIISRASHR